MENSNQNNMDNDVKQSLDAVEADVAETTEKGTKETSLKSPKNLIILTTAIVVMFVGAALAYCFFTKSWIFKEKPAEEVVSDTNAIFTKEDNPKFDASTVTQPLVMAFYKDFTGDKEAKTTDFDFTKTHEAYVKLVEKEVDLIVVTSPSDDELKMIADINDEYVVTPVVREGFVFLVNKSNAVNSLTIEQVQDIYTGKITNWKAVGGPDQKIAAFQRPENSGSQTGMLQLVMKDKKIMKPEREDLVEPTMVGLVASVASLYDNSSDAIGYSYYYYVTTMYQDIDADVADGVKLMAINGVKPEPKTIQDDSYPFTTSYYIVTRKSDEKNEKVQKLKNAMLSLRGQNIAKEAFYVPVK